MPCISLIDPESLNHLLTKLARGEQIYHHGVIDVVKFTVKEPESEALSVTLPAFSVQD